MRTHRSLFFSTLATVVCPHRKLFLLVALAVVLPWCSRADNIAPCVAATLNNIVGATCVIGDKAFNFTSYQDGTENFYLSQLMLTPDASNPSSPGFTLSLPPGVSLSATSTDTTTYTVAIVLDYTVSLDNAAHGVSLLGTSVSASGDTVTGSPLGNQTSFAENYLSPGFPCGSISQSGASMADLYTTGVTNPSTTTFSNISFCGGGPFTTASGFAELEVAANYGGSASIDGGSFFVDESSGSGTGGGSSVPEPGTLLLLAAGLLPLDLVRRRRALSRRIRH